LKLVHFVHLTLCAATFCNATLCDYTLCSNTPEAGGVYRICSCTGSQKGEEERVEDSMYLIPEAGGAYLELYRQPEGGEVEGGGQYVSNT
jgi:hypothetical protein